MKVARELKALQNEPIDGVRIVVNEDNLAVIRAEVDGPAGTPFEGGLFKMRLELTPEFPAVPPVGFFQTKIFHPNVSEKGEICVNTLKRDWKAEYGLRHIFMVIRCLLIDPNPESALNEEAGKLLLESYVDYCKMARIWTDIHARRKGSENRDNNVAEGASTTDTGGKTADAPTKKNVNKKRLKRL
eukprot:CAMPEP_0198736698 /NCGR_PEP_ID=MMETSP1475-20131203/67490_1 /TAXON_ID= ORGANISM="Unidentified sp., Strain CCMP1999" /NCGR_SAMPLE_ID=MMETSP1475 /ASSEMBLY_ACC=CAM_ASM_001111 /LENGTH=185 /DNA_ID=CAMNT_0044500547 /DNA_START=52 /DNA_END=609 /DNA_ORIENTATION=+